MTPTNRRYDIDWLRVIAIGLLLIYHIAIIFQPWGIFIGFIQSEKPIESLWIPMAMLNVWRIPLLFFVSGMGVCFAMKKRTWKQLIAERSKRILLPFLFGIACIVPLHVIIWQNYYNQDITYIFNPSHLWFLGNIFIYVIVLSPVFYLLQKNEDSKAIRLLKKLFINPLGLVPVMAFFVIEAVALKPEPFELYAMTPHGFFMGLLAFFFGFCFVLSGETFWKMILKWRWTFLVFALVMYFVRFFAFEFKAPGYLMAMESNVWIFAVFGFAYKYLNRPSKTLSYLSKGVYPIYILHMIFLFLGAVLILPLDLPTVLEFILIVVFTTAGCFISYELIIKRISFLRPLFGLKSTNNTRTVYRANSNKKLKLFNLKTN